MPSDNGSDNRRLSTATEDQLSGLHGLLAETFRDILLSGGAKGAELNVIRQFLKDNNISCDGQNNNTLKEIEANLPDIDWDEVKLKVVG